MTFLISLIVCAGAVFAQSAEELSAQVERYDRLQRQTERARTDEFVRDYNANFQASGGRLPVQAGLQRALEAALRMSGEGAYWQYPRAGKGRYNLQGKGVLITASGVYCFETYGGFASARYACYQPGGAPYASFEYEYR